MDLDLLIRKVLFIFLPFLLAMSFHELAHAVVAQIRGDDTARLMGRVSLNPFAHVDWVGTFALPLSLLFFGGGVFFGWAKPVPVNVSRLHNPRWDLVLVAAAGPLSNVFLALLTAVFIGFLHPLLYGSTYWTDIVYFAAFFVRLNLFLALFNILPFHPLDGGKVLAGFMPDRFNDFMERNELIFTAVLFLLVLGGGLSLMAGPVFSASDQLMSWALGER